MLVTLSERHGPTDGRVCRNSPPRTSQRNFPNLVFFFQPPDIVTQVLNFGLPAPIDMQIVGPQVESMEELQIAQLIRDRVAQIPGAVDAHLQQVPLTPELLSQHRSNTAQPVGIDAA